MRVTRQDMDASHRRIVEGAARLFRERGTSGTSVADAMRQAGMTHGGFYRHFANMDELVIEALRSVFDEFGVPLEERLKTEPAAELVAEYKAVYLSEAHVDQPGAGCPIPALAGELARASVAVKAAFGAGVRRLIAAIASAQRGSPAAQQAKATRELAMVVGAVLIARACDPETAQAVIDACRD